MSTPIACPHCRELLLLEKDAAGTTVKCPMCKRPFRAEWPADAEAIREGVPVWPAPPVQMVDGRIESAPDALIAKVLPHPQWQKVVRGLDNMYWAAVVAAVVVAMIVAEVCLSRLTGYPFGGSWGLGVMERLMVVSACVGCLVYLLSGMIRCLATPDEARARSLIVAALVCLLLFVAIIMLSLVGVRLTGTVVAEFRVLMWFLLSLLWPMLPLCSVLLLVLYLRRLAFFFAAPKLASNCRYCMIFLIVTWMPLLAIPHMAWLPGLREVFLEFIQLYGEVIFLTLLASIVWLANLLRPTRKHMVSALAIDQAARRALID